MRERTPWNAWLRAGLAVGLPPAQFWRLSLKEWRALVAPSEPAALDRAAFDMLIARYPDQTHG